MGLAINKMAFFPPQDTYSENDVSVWLTISKDKRIPVYFVKCSRPRFCLLLSHGNAEDIGVNRAYCKWLSAELQVDVIMYDYLGYGLASGKPSEEGLYQSVNAVFHYLTKTLEYPPQHIVLYGKSLGSAPTVELASKHRVQGVILVSPIASGARVVMPGSNSLLLDRAFCNNIGKVKKIKDSVFLIHGTADEVVHVSNGEALYSACKNVHPLPPVWVKNAGHNDIESNFQEEFLGSIKMFLDHCWEMRILLGESSHNF